MKNSWTMEELECLKLLEVDEDMLYTTRQVFFIKRPFRKLRYIWSCNALLLQQLFLDMCSQREWFWLKPTEEYEWAKAQRFEDYQWVCQGEKWLTEYTFRLEWFLGLWDSQTADIELTATGSRFTEVDKENLRKEIAYILEPEYKKNLVVIENVFESVPAVIMRDIGIRRANKIKQWVEELYDVTLTVILKE